MELWIRSQDKENLIRATRIDVDDNMIKINFNSYYNGCDYIIMGEYNSKERALEVLDEIQTKIAQNECLKNMMPKLTDIRGHEEQLGQLFKDIVYEMPIE